MTKTRWILTVASMLALTGATACGGGEVQEEEEPEDTSGNETVVVAEPAPEPVATPAPSPVRIIHAAAGAHEGMAGGTAGEAQWGDVAFAAASEYAEVAPAEGGAAYALTAGEAVVEGSAELEAGVPATVVLYSTADDMAAVAALTIADEAGSVTGQIRGRVVNALHGAEAIDICLPGRNSRAPGQSVFNGVPYGEVGGIPSFPSRYQPMNLAGVERVQIRTAEDNPCTGAVIGLVTLPPIDLNAAHNLTMVVVGRAGRARPRVARQMLICEDAPAAGACVALPLATR